MNDFNAKLLRRLARAEGKIQFGFAGDADEKALAQFYGQMFPDRAEFLTRHWRWLYRTERNLAFSSPIVAVERETGRVVGHGGLIQATLQRGQEQRDAVWMMDFAIVPEYQRGMVGGGLVQIGSSYCPLRIAFLNERSWGMVSKMGWRTHFLTTAFQLPLRPEKLPHVQSLTDGWIGMPAISRLGGAAIRSIYKALTLATSPLERVPASVENLRPFTQTQTPAALNVPRSADFLDWRIVSHPHADEYFVLRPAGSDDCAGIFRVMNLGGYRRLHFLALLRRADPSQRLSNFFAASFAGH